MTLTKGFYAAVFPTTTGQNSYITNLVSMTPSTVTSPRRWDNYNRLRGADLGAGWPASAAVDPDSIVGVLRAKTGYDLTREDFGLGQECAPYDAPFRGSFAAVMKRHVEDYEKF